MKRYLVAITEHTVGEHGVTVKGDTIWAQWFSPTELIEWLLDQHELTWASSIILKLLGGK